MPPPDLTPLIAGREKSPPVASLVTVDVPVAYTKYPLMSFFIRGFCTRFSRRVYPADDPDPERAGATTALAVVLLTPVASPCPEYVATGVRA